MLFEYLKALFIDEDRSLFIIFTAKQPFVIVLLLLINLHHFEFSHLLLDLGPPLVPLVVLARQHQLSLAQLCIDYQSRRIGSQPRIAQFGLLLLSQEGA
jgi:hypothetical protein